MWAVQWAAQTVDWKAGHLDTELDWQMVELWGDSLVALKVVAKVD